MEQHTISPHNTYSLAMKRAAEIILENPYVNGMLRDHDVALLGRIASGHPDFLTHDISVEFNNLGQTTMLYTQTTRFDLALGKLSLQDDGNEYVERGVNVLMNTGSSGTTDVQTTSDRAWNLTAITEVAHQIELLFAGRKLNMLFSTPESREKVEKIKFERAQQAEFKETFEHLSRRMYVGQRRRDAMLNKHLDAECVMNVKNKEFAVSVKDNVMTVTRTK